MSSTLKTESLIRVEAPIHQARGLPNDRYVTETSFVEDRDRVMAPNWACIGFTDQLDTPNYALPIDFMGLPLLVTRDDSDNIRVFHNVCSHRGMHLADKPCRNNGTIRCPYHSWTYRLDGSLHGTPHVGGYGQHTHPDFNQSSSGLKQIRSATWLGTIFINLSGDAADFDTYIAPIKSQWSKFTTADQLDRFTPSADHSKLSLTVKSNWKLTVENFLESYHLPSVHPELNRISPLSEHYCVDDFDNGGGQGSLNYQRLEKDGKRLQQLDNWPEDKLNQAEYPVLYPNTFFGIHADQLFILYLQPVSANETTEHVRLFYVDQSATDPLFAPHRNALLSAWDGVFKEDIFAVERMQNGRASPAYDGGVFSPAMDGPTLHFHRWVARKLLSDQQA